MVATAPLTCHLCATSQPESDWKPSRYTDSLHQALRPPSNPHLDLSAGSSAIPGVFVDGVAGGCGGSRHPPSCAPLLWWGSRHSAANWRGRRTAVVRPGKLTRASLGFSDCRRASHNTHYTTQAHEARGARRHDVRPGEFRRLGSRPRRLHAGGRRRRLRRPLRRRRAGGRPKGKWARRFVQRVPLVRQRWVPVPRGAGMSRVCPAVGVSLSL